MQYLGRMPSPPLDRFIDRIWYCSDASLHARERVLPSGGTLGLAVNLVEDRIGTYEAEDSIVPTLHGGAIVVGPATRSYFIDPRQRGGLVGVHFRPGGAYAFLGISPFEIVDTHVALGDLWGAAGRNLRERLLEAGSPRAQLHLIEALLMQRLQRVRPGHPAVSAAVEALRDGGQRVRVADIARAVDLSHRRFVELFEREVGVTPKLFARLQRFHLAKSRVARLSGPPSWATFALECGYFDQSHMIREFVDFAGISPTAYQRSRGEETLFDHVVHAFGEQASGS